MKKSDKFKIIHEERDGWNTELMVLVEKGTGVQYLFCNKGYGGGMSVMVDKDGKPLLYQED